MVEKDVLKNLQEIDGLLAKCVDPALTRADHDAIRNVMQFVTQRVKLSYKLEVEKDVKSDEIKN